jgi:hypothetical protein
VLVLARQAHGEPTAAGTSPKSRHAEAGIAPEKNGKGLAKSRLFPRANGGLEKELRPTAGCHKSEDVY